MAPDRLRKDTDGDDDQLANLSTLGLSEIIRHAEMAEQKGICIKEGINQFRTNPDYSIDSLESLDIDALRAQLLLLKGLGQKAVDCFILLGLDRPIFPVDVNVFKLVSKAAPSVFQGSILPPSFTNPKDVRKVKDFLETTFEPSTSNYRVLHTYLLLAEKYKIAI